ncbi:membrane anchoring protein efr3a [Cichlidogyrus casuarinus]|uniref:Membrane anchoring protein efr3a n=1 Tax=Cichlidogyrus casuarinus TaxID=1844966 RepID=A0ABD2PRY0_9PLAT
MRSLLQKILSRQDQLSLQRNVLKQCTMDKIVTALLLNTREGFLTSEVNFSKQERSPDGMIINPQEIQRLKESIESLPGNSPPRDSTLVFKELVSLVSYTDVEPVVCAILTHLDRENLWCPSLFPLLIFELLLEALKNTQLAYHLVKQLINHLCKHNDSPVQNKIGIVQTLNHASNCNISNFNDIDLTLI